MPDTRAPGLARWAASLTTLQTALCANQISENTAICGLRLRAGHGPVRDAWLNLAQRICNSELIKLSAETPVSRLMPSVDISASLSRGQRVEEPGLLAQAKGKLSILSGADRCSDAMAAVLAQAIDQNPMGKRGIFLIALDETGPDDEDTIPPSLSERLPLTIDLHGIAWHDICDESAPLEPLEPTVIQCLEDPLVRSHPTIPDKGIAIASEITAALGQKSMRPTLAIVKLAAACAALDDRDEVTAGDMAAAIEMICGPVVSRTDQAEELDDETPQIAPNEPQSQADNQSAQPDHSSREENKADDNAGQLDFDDLQDMLVAMTQAGKVEFATMIERGRTTQARSHAADGKAGQMRSGAKRGRPAGLVARPPYHGARLDVVSTLRTAAPWQKLRARAYELLGEDAPDRPLIRASDYRYIRYKQPTETTAIFAVDASGSTALDRLSEAKGAIEQLLADCYVRRDSVAMVTFRGVDSQVILQPTRSLVAAKKNLIALPGGGGTPLASGLKTALDLAVQEKSKGKSPLMVVLTDGRGNIALDGKADRTKADQDARSIAQLAAAQSIKTIFIDIARRPRDKARELAATMQADYCALPRLDAAAVSRIVGSYMGDAAGVGR